MVGFSAALSKTAVAIFVIVFVMVFFMTAWGLYAVGRPWLRAFMYGTPVPLVAVIAMKLRGNPPDVLIGAYIRLRRRGIDVTISEVEIAYIDALRRPSDSLELEDRVIKGRR